jgi:DNA modification methylase
MDSRIIQGDALTVLQGIRAASFDAVLCDPPYGLKEKRNARSASPRKSSREARRRGGFMKMPWDADVPQPVVWREILRVLKPGAILLAFGGTRTHHRLMCAIEDAGFEIHDCIVWLHGQGFPKAKSCLKPAWEPIIVARKRGSVVPLNIEGSRINPGGRWPANVLLDENAGAALDSQSGILTSGNNPAKRSADKHRNVYAGWTGAQCLVRRGTDSGGASRFFYCAKASRKERGEQNTHPTVKPLKLLEYLARLILPPKEGRAKRKLLAPFAGSGSEMIAGRRAGWDEVLGIEVNPAYVKMAEDRIGELKNARHAVA